MGLFEKLKSAIFEEDEEDDNDEEKVIEKKEKKPEIKAEKKQTREEKFNNQEDEIVKKVDVEKTIEKQKQAIVINDYNAPVEEKKSPIIFDDDDFLSDTREINFSKTPTKEEKILYGGYEKKEEIKETKKFHPSPVISPVYGVLNKNYVSQNSKEYEAEHKSLDDLFKEDSDKPTLEDVRQKAYGDSIDQEYEELKETTKEYEQSSESKTLLYDMQDENDTPGIDKVTIGDAEEYYNDLGLEYEVDYRDSNKNSSKASTRSTKNRDLSERIEKEDNKNTYTSTEKKESNIKATKPKTAKEIKKEKVYIPEEDEIDDSPEEKNLYDLIDMMYDKDKKKE